MACRGDDAVAPLAHRQRDQLRILVERLGGDADVGLAGDHPFGDLRRAALVHFELDRRVAGDEIAHHHRQRVARLGMGRRQHEAAALAGGELGTRPLEVFRFAQDALGDLEHRLARLGDAGEALAAALEDGDPEFFLEQNDLLRDARLRGVQHLGRLRDIESLAPDFDDVAELLEFHGGT